MLFSIQLLWPSSTWTLHPLGLARVRGLTPSFLFPCSACYSCACSSCLRFFFWKSPQWKAWVLWHMAAFSLCNYLSLLLICCEWSWPRSKCACGFPHLWLFAVVSALAESPSVQEEPEQFSHCFLLYFLTGIPQVFTCSPCFLNAHWKSSVPQVFFALEVKGRWVLIWNLFSLLFVVPISFTRSCRSVLSRLICSIDVPVTFSYSCVPDMHQGVWVSSPEGTFQWGHKPL